LFSQVKSRAACSEGDARRWQQTQLPSEVQLVVPEEGPDKVPATEQLPQLSSSVRLVVEGTPEKVSQTVPDIEQKPQLSGKVRLVVGRLQEDGLGMLSHVSEHLPQLPGQTELVGEMMEADVTRGMEDTYQK
jgi:hypothetical protein